MTISHRNSSMPFLIAHTISPLTLYWTLTVHVWLPFALFPQSLMKSPSLSFSSYHSTSFGNDPHMDIYPTFSLSADVFSLISLWWEDPQHDELNHKTLVASQWILKQTSVTFKSQILKCTISSCLGLPDPAQTLKPLLCLRIQLWHRSSKEMGLVDE